MSDIHICPSYGAIRSNYLVVFTLCYVAYVWATSPYLNTLIKNVLFIAFISLFAWLILPIPPFCVNSSKRIMSMVYIVIFALLNVLFWYYEKGLNQKMEEQKRKHKQRQKK